MVLGLLGFAGSNREDAIENALEEDSGIHRSDESKNSKISIVPNQIMEGQSSSEIEDHDVRKKSISMVSGFLSKRKEMLSQHSSGGSKTKYPQEGNKCINIASESMFKRKEKQGNDPDESQTNDPRDGKERNKCINMASELMFNIKKEKTKHIQKPKPSTSNGKRKVKIQKSSDVTNQQAWKEIHFMFDERKRSNEDLFSRPALLSRSFLENDIIDTRTSADIASKFLESIKSINKIDFLTDETDDTSDDELD